MDSSLRIIFLAHPRSGSSSLYQILQLHPELNILEEPFNENFPNWNPLHKNYREQVHDTVSLDTQLAEIFTLHNGIKILDYQLPDELMIHLLQDHNCEIIFLRRKNLLQSIVSVLIAEQTKLWKKWEMTKPIESYYHDLRPLDVYDIQQRVAGLKKHLDFLESVIDALLGNMATKLIYEELYFAPPVERNAQVGAIWNFLKIPPLESEKISYYLEPEQVKINSSATYQLIPNAQEIQQSCGNDLTGWLYEE
jgi:hypothetical protein